VKTAISSVRKGADRDSGRAQDSRQADMIGRSLNEAYRIDALIKQLLLYVRQKPPVFLDVNIKALCDDVLVSAGLVRDLKNIGISLDVAAGTVWKTDYEKLRQVLLNLVTNAVDAMQGQGALAIKAVVSSGQLILDVSDTGEGIDKAYIEKIFDPFFTTKGSGKGTGLGLAIVKNSVQDLHGEISVGSKKGEGTVFTIKLSLVPIANLHHV
ncbi:MAG: HAMP domain-containing histidine kinase, partial [Deltaproteobacteria bacterium]|nr:HAMP domain-containing histidine kinase [Deltaproteobacteria bacterium]